MGDLTAHEHRVQHMRQHQVSNELTFPGQEPVVFAPQ